MARTKGSSYKSQLLRLTCGLVNNLTDLCLFVLFFHLQAYKLAYGKRTYGEAINKAVHLTKIVNANSLDRIIYRATTKGYLERKEDFLKITQLGQNRLQRILPVYESKRPWDGLLYLITYDIPDRLKKERDQLRLYLKKLGCGLMQESVWLTPYNPKRIIADFVVERKITGLVLVSELREGSAIGGHDMKETVARIYNLDSLNQGYRDFIAKAEAHQFSKEELVFNFLFLLKRDPQLPFPLLPADWSGEKANLIYKKSLKVNQRKLNQW